MHKTTETYVETSAIPVLSKGSRRCINKNLRRRQGLQQFLGRKNKSEKHRIPETEE